jgi:hypothetical protein
LLLLAELEAVAPQAVAVIAIVSAVMILKIANNFFFIFLAFLFCLTAQYANTAIMKRLYHKKHEKVNCALLFLYCYLSVF